MSYRENMLVLAFEQFEALKGPTTDPRWGTALKILAAGDLDGAARLVGELVSNVKYIPLDPVYRPEEFAASFNHAIYEMVIGTLSNLASLKPTFSPAVTEMLCKAADSGYPDAAYNAANGLAEKAKSKDEYRRAEHYFKLAIASITDPSKRAAAIVNYTPLIRDGLLTGQKDYLTAISLYETAAEDGVVTAMYNAGNVCMWLVAEGHQGLIDKAAGWFRKVVEATDGSRQLLEVDNPAFMQECRQQSIKHLADFHINAKIKLPDLDYGIKMARQIAIAEGEDRTLRNWLLEQGICKRIMSLSAPDHASGSDHWHYLLSALDWKAGPIMRCGPDLPFDTFEVKHSLGIALFVVLDYVFEPIKHYSPLDQVIGRMFIPGIDHIFVVSRIGTFEIGDGTVHVPVIVYSPNTRCIATLNPRMSPEDIIENTRSGVYFLDPVAGIDNCIFPIALNMLNSGKKISEGLNPRSTYAKMDGVCIPALSPDVSFGFMQSD